jgi:hypothetical protein
MDNDRTRSAIISDADIEDIVKQALPHGSISDGSRKGCHLAFSETAIAPRAAAIFSAKSLTPGGRKMEW